MNNNISAGTSFPGIRDLMQDFDKHLDNQKIAVIERVRKHLSEIMIVFRQAKNWLEDGDIWENMTWPISHFIRKWNYSESRTKINDSTHVVVQSTLSFDFLFSINFVWHKNILAETRLSPAWQGREQEETIRWKYKTTVINKKKILLKTTVNLIKRIAGLEKWFVCIKNTTKVSTNFEFAKL